MYANSLPFSSFLLFQYLRWERHHGAIKTQHKEWKYFHREEFVFVHLIGSNFWTILSFFHFGFTFEEMNRKAKVTPLKHLCDSQTLKGRTHSHLASFQLHLWILINHPALSHFQISFEKCHAVFIHRKPHYISSKLV